MPLLDASPSSTLDLVVTGGTQSSYQPGDGYGTLTVTAGTPIVRVVPPRSGRYARVTGFQYEAAATEHTATLLVTMLETRVNSEAAAGQAVIAVEQMPVNIDGTVPASGDWIITRNENDIWVSFKIASISGRNITVTVSNGDADGSGLTVIVPRHKALYFLGAPGDHSKRQFRCKASTVSNFSDAVSGICTAPAQAQPILLHVDNATNAGYLTGPFYTHVAL